MIHKPESCIYTIQDLKHLAESIRKARAEDISEVLMTMSNAWNERGDYIFRQDPSFQGFLLIGAYESAVLTFVDQELPWVMGNHPHEGPFAVVEESVFNGNAVTPVLTLALAVVENEIERKHDAEQGGTDT